MAQSRRAFPSKVRPFTVDSATKNALFMAIGDMTASAKCGHSRQVRERATEQMARACLDLTAATAAVELAVGGKCAGAQKSANRTRVLLQQS
jgi:hypothetical protein